MRIEELESKHTAVGLTSAERAALERLLDELCGPVPFVDDARTALTKVLRESDAVLLDARLSGMQEMYEVACVHIRWGHERISKAMRAAIEAVRRGER